jgi:hypothetical protein
VRAAQYLTFCCAAGRKRIAALTASTRLGAASGAGLNCFDNLLMAQLLPGPDAATLLVCVLFAASGTFWSPSMLAVSPSAAECVGLYADVCLVQAQLAYAAKGRCRGVPEPTNRSAQVLTLLFQGSQSDTGQARTSLREAARLRSAASELQLCLIVPSPPPATYAPASEA